LGCTPLLPPGFDPAGPFLAVTLHPFAPLADPRVRQVAEQLGGWSSRQGLQVLYVPHCRAPEGPDGASDVDVAATMASVGGGFALAPPQAPPPDARGVAWAAATARLVLTSRYHPVVFATSASVPVLALPNDVYTKVKLVGALTHVGLEGWHMDLALLGTDELTINLDNLLAHHDAVTSGLQVTQQRLDVLEARRRTAVAGVVARARRRR
jgi:hypothetical protein